MCVQVTERLACACVFRTELREQVNALIVTWHAHQGKQAAGASVEELR